MTGDGAQPPDERGEDAALVAAARAGDHAAFSALSERYRHRLRVHCYRMLGSFDQAEELVQETLLRAWRGRESFEGRSLLRTWLYRIATNACLNALERTPQRVLPRDVALPVTAETPAAEALPAPRWAPELPWLQPYPDDLLELAVSGELEPDDAAARRESIELAFLAALQHLPPRQRAVLLLSDVVEWSAAEVAQALEVSVASVTSTLQRARAALRAELPAGRDDWAPNAPISEEQRTALKIFMDAWEKGDLSALVERLCDDARWAMPPAPLWFEGRGAIENLLRLYPPDWQGRRFRLLPVGANRQPAAAAYLRAPGDASYRLSSLHVLRVERGQIAEITTFSGELAAGFRLAPVLGP
jgi:RNA polymerase sigma-70 factor (ECF subfamily)